MILLPLLVLGFIVYVVASGRPGRSVDQPEIRAVRRRPSSTADGAERRREWQVARALARTEARRLLVHPAVVVGLALSLLSLPDVPFGLVGTEGSRFVLRAAIVQVGLAAFPLAGMTLIAVNLAVLRARRQGTAEVEEPAAADERGRTLGHLLSVLGPVALWSVVMGPWLVWTLRQADRARHGLGVDALVELAIGPVLVGCAGACGVLLARLVPFGAAGPIAVVGLGWAQVVAATAPAPDTNRLVWLGWWVNDPAPPEVWPREAGWHLVYLLGLGVLVATTAALVSGRTRRTAMALVAAGAVVAASALVQVQPLSGAEAAMAASWVHDTAAHQRCSTVDGVTTCAYPPYDFSADWRRVAAGVRAALPTAAAVAPVTVRQRVHPYELARLPGEVRRLFRPPDAGAGEAVEVATEVRWGADGASELVLATNVASALIGLPSAPVGSWKAGGGCAVAGQARGVVVLWLAARATPDAEAALRAWLRQPDAVLQGGGVTGESSGSSHTLLLDGWSMTAGSPLTWSGPDLGVTADLLDRPAEQVAAAFSVHWAELVAASTTTARLAELAGIPRPPRPTGRSDAPGAHHDIVGPAGPPCR